MQLRGRNISSGQISGREAAAFKTVNSMNGELLAGQLTKDMHKSVAI